MDRPGEGTKFTIDRKIFSSDIWYATPWKLKIWFYLVGNANHTDGEWMGIKLKRGQIIRSYRRIQKDCSYKVGYRIKKPSLHTIHRICEELTKELRTERRKEQGGQVITILNYNELQPFKKHERNDERNDRGTIGEHNKNDKNVLTTSSFKNDNGIPFKEILEAYHDILSDLPKVKVFSPKRKSMLKARWQEKKDRQSLKWWEGYFKYVRQSDFLMGREAKFKANLEWLINARNIVKVIEGNYN